MAEGVPATLKSARLIPLTNETSKPIQKFTLPFSPGNSTRVIQSFADNDELSEISEFEPDNDTVIERAATGVSVSTPCNHELKSTHRKIDRVGMNGSSSATSATGMKRSSESVSKTGERAERIVQKLPETGKPLLTSDSPIFGSSSDTQINVSPKPQSNVDTLLTTTDHEVDDGPSVVSQDFVSTDRLKKSDIDQCGPFDRELIIASAGKPPTRSISVEEELGQHARSFTPCYGDNQKGHSRIEITKDMSVPSKIAGNRRKRETIESSSKASIEADDKFTPPRKKSRDDRLTMKEVKVKSNETSLAATSLSRVKRCTKTTKGSSSGIEPMTVDFDELPEIKSTYQGTRRSSRIKKRQTAATASTRANVRRGKTQKGKPADGQSTCGMERMKVATASLQDTGAKVSHGAPSIHSSCPIPIPTGESPSLKINGHLVSNATSPTRCRIAHSLLHSLQWSRGMPNISLQKRACLKSCQRSAF